MGIHLGGQECPGCLSKLQTAHPTLQDWFSLVKSNFKNAHISWAWRGKEEQEQAFSDKKTRFHFPDSPHNHLEGEIPCSLALDLFVLSESNVALFPLSFYKEVEQLTYEYLNFKNQIFWGGRYKTLGDFDHFELKKTTPVASEASSLEA